MKMHLAQVKVLVIACPLDGAPLVWGKGETVGEAVRAAGSPARWQAFLCHESTIISGRGRVSHPAGFVPREIQRRNVPRRLEVCFDDEEE